MNRDPGLNRVKCTRLLSKFTPIPQFSKRTRYDIGLAINKYQLSEIIIFKNNKLFLLAGNLLRDSARSLETKRAPQYKPDHPLLANVKEDRSDRSLSSGWTSSSPSSTCTRPRLPEAVSSAYARQTTFAELKDIEGVFLSTTPCLRDL